MTTQIQRRERNKQIRRVRVADEPVDIPLNPEVHVGIVQRLAMSGMDRDAIAAVLGVRVRTLRKWEAENDEIAKSMATGHAEAASEVIQALYDQAVGWIDPKTGRRRGANVVAGVFLAKNWLGYASEPAQLKPPEEDDGKGQEFSADQVSALARKLIGKAEGSDEGPVIDMDAVDAEFEEFD